MLIVLSVFGFAGLCCSLDLVALRWFCCLWVCTLVTFVVCELVSFLSLLLLFMVFVFILVF